MFVSVWFHSWQFEPCGGMMAGINPLFCSPVMIKEKSVSLDAAQRESVPAPSRPSHTSCSESLQ